MIEGGGMEQRMKKCFHANRLVDPRHISLDGNELYVPPFTQRHRAATSMKAAFKRAAIERPRMAAFDA